MRNLLIITQQEDKDYVQVTALSPSVANIRTKIRDITRDAKEYQIIEATEYREFRRQTGQKLEWASLKDGELHFNRAFAEEKVMEQVRNDRLKILSSTDKEVWINEQKGKVDQDLLNHRQKLRDLPAWVEEKIKKMTWLELAEVTALRLLEQM